MKLNKKDINYFLDNGYLIEDIQQIIDLKYKFYLNDKQIPQKKAKLILKHTDLLSGLGRSAFHRTAMRCNILIVSNLFD